jgi:hypothetical protein
MAAVTARLTAAVTGIVLAFSISACAPSDDESSGEVAPTAAEVEMIDSFIALAHDPRPERGKALPLADRVQLGLGRAIHAVRSDEDLAEPGGWVLEVDHFRAHSGPFSALDLAKEWPGNTITTVGEHRHCASPPVPPPPELIGLRRISVQPDPDEFDTCLRWWSVDFFLDDRDEVVAITLDLWDP